MQGAEKEWAGAAVTARPEVGFRGENNMNKAIGQTPSVQGSGLWHIAGCNPVAHAGTLFPLGWGRGGSSLELAGDTLMFLMRQEAGRGQQCIGEGYRLARGQRKARNDQKVLERLLGGRAAIQLDGDAIVAVWSDIPAGEGEQGFVVVGSHASSCVECQSRNITIARAENLPQTGRGIASRAPNKKAPHCGGSAGRGKWQKDVRRTERRRSNEHGQVTWNTLGKKMAPYGGESGRGQHGRSTLQLYSEPRQAYGVAQVTRVLRSQKNAPACHGSRGINIHITELIQRQLTPLNESIQVVWIKTETPIPTPCYLLIHYGFFFVEMGFTGKRAAEFNVLSWKLNRLIHQVEASRPTLQGDRRHDD